MVPEGGSERLSTFLHIQLLGNMVLAMNGPAESRPNTVYGRPRQVRPAKHYIGHVPGLFVFVGAPLEPFRPVKIKTDDNGQRA